uniref:High affinity iron permease 1 n=1 Tax=Ganoderma boninense TaxID=34458 RepID=A0A5K1K3K2_9APHY|nr:High affinity iron permease 1 [Ganoderma boninense]
MRFSAIVAFALINFAAAAYVPRVDVDAELTHDVETNVGSLAARGGRALIGQRCNSDAQCSSACCGFKTGKCAGAIVAQLADGGCGHGGTHPKHKFRELAY